MNSQYKICPKCQTPADLSASLCFTCGRAYQTQFAPAPEQTQVFTSPVPPAAPTYGYPPYTQASPAYANTDLMLDAYAEQYKTLVHQCYLCFFLLGITIIGLIIGLFLWQRFGEIRAKVAALGVSPDVWEAPLLEWRRGVLATCLKWVGGVIATIMFLIFLFIFHVTRPAMVDQPTEPRSEYSRPTYDSSYYRPSSSSRDKAAQSRPAFEERNNTSSSSAYMPAPTPKPVYRHGGIVPVPGAPGTTTIGGYTNGNEPKTNDGRGGNPGF